MEQTTHSISNTTVFSSDFLVHKVPLNLRNKLLVKF